MHCCNDVGSWGAGVVLAISKAWRGPEAHYRSWSNRCRVRGEILPLGATQFVDTGAGITVANMIGQTLGRGDHPPVKYDAIYECLKTVGQHADATGQSIVAPMFGAGLAGGKWEIIEALIETAIPKHISVVIYDFEMDPVKCTFPPEGGICTRCKIISERPRKCTAPLSQQTYHNRIERRIA